MHEERDRRDRELLAAREHETLLAAYFPEVRDRLAVWLPLADAEEVLQRVFLRLCSELAAGKQYSVPFRVVVWQVTGWTVKDFYRDPQRTPSALPEEWNPADPHDTAVEVEDRDWLESILADLPPRDREIANLRFGEGLDIEVIAERVAISRNAVDQALFRVRRELRGMFDG
jgi:RNA polymerase sigma factor (sigma-70 family)